MRGEGTRCAKGEHKLGTRSPIRSMGMTPSDPGGNPAAPTQIRERRYRLRLGLAVGAAAWLTLAGPALATDTPTTPTPTVDQAAAVSTSDHVAPAGAPAAGTGDPTSPLSQDTSSDTTTATTIASAADPSTHANGTDPAPGDAGHSAGDAPGTHDNVGPANNNNANNNNANNNNANNGNANDGNGESTEVGEAGIDDADTSADGNGSAAAEQTTTVDQAASATAEADQDGAGNTHTSVLVNDPGNAPAVSQENAVAANASATTAADITPAPNQSAATDPSVPVSAPVAATVDVVQQATADATATQTDTSNLNLSVRVLSPGDDGPVTQANTATANATIGSGAPGGDGGIATNNNNNTDGSSALATANQLGVSNTNVAVRVFSPGDSGGVRQTNTAAAEAATDPDEGPATGPSSLRGTNATTTQSGASNTNVVIRVGSTGHDAGAIQTTGTNANGSDLPQNGSDTGVTVDQAGRDTNLVVSINGNDLPVPLAGTNGAITVWRWTWNWDGRGIPTDPSSWNWNWDGTDPSPSGQGTVTTEQASAGLVAGTWIWNWAWSRPAGQTWDWAPELSLDCACVWIWDWSWNWTEEPAAASTPAAEPTDDAPAGDGAVIEQSNVVTADASATVEATIDGSFDQAAPSGLTSAFAGQIVFVEQQATATATAVQSDVSNIAVGWKRATQANTVSAEATADATTTAIQHVEQAHDTETGPTHRHSGVEQWAGQQIEVIQSAVAGVIASQSHVGNHSQDGINIVVVRAAARADVVAQQEIDQASVLGRGDHDLWAGQLFQSEQIAEASAAGLQSDDDIDPGVLRPSSRTARSTATALTAAYSLQSITQLAAGAADTSQIARQLVQVLQGSAASATTNQPPRGPVDGDGQSLATSEADASGRAFMEELSTQASIEAGTQETTQNISILQLADATSSANGGVSGGGRVVNCATVGQSAQQAIGVDPLVPLSPMRRRSALPRPTTQGQGPGPMRHLRPNCSPRKPLHSRSRVRRRAA